MKCSIIIPAAVILAGILGSACLADLAASRTGDPCAATDMVYIAGGDFLMGDSFNDGWADELPVHTVTLDSFYIGKYEVTNSQYCRFLNSALGSGVYFSGGTVYGSGNNQIYCDTCKSSTDSQIDYNDGVFSVRTKRGRDMSNDPVALVSWYGAAAYCNWRSKQQGKQECYNLSTWQCDFNKKGYRLATEAEWEYAARGGLAGKRFPWGDTITHSHANYQGSRLYSYDTSATIGFHQAWSDGTFPHTSPAGSFPANGFGVYDMAGNIWEWCNDWYSGDYYSSSESKNPTGPANGTYRVLRGGSWLTYAINCRASRRDSYAPDNRSYGFGFRIALAAVK